MICYQKNNDLYPVKTENTLKKIKDTANVLSISSLYAILFLSFVLFPNPDSKASLSPSNEITSYEATAHQETISQKTDFQNIISEIAEIRENEEDDKHEELFPIGFISNSSYSLVSLVHQRFKNNTSYSHTDNLSVVPDYILFCTYRI